MFNTLEQIIRNCLNGNRGVKEENRVHKICSVGSETKLIGMLNDLNKSCEHVVMKINEKKPNCMSLINVSIEN